MKKLICKSMLFTTIGFVVATYCQDPQQVYEQIFETTTKIDQIGDFNSALVHQTSGSASNSASIWQFGMRDTASLIQDSRGFGSLSNVGTVMQRGNLNNASIEQTGQGHVASIIQQGNNNRAQQMISGLRDSTYCIQRGNNNNSYQYLSGDDNKQMAVQSGNRNELIQIHGNSHGQYYRVYQEGNAMRMVIINGR